MGRQRQRRISNLFWILADSEEPRPTPEEIDEVIRAIEDPSRKVRDTLKYAVKIIRRDTDRLNAALEESEEEREERRRKEREYRAEYRRRKRVSGKSEMSENGQSRTERTERTGTDNPGDSSASSPASSPVRPVPPTDAHTHTLTQTGGKPPVGARAVRGASTAPSVDKSSSSSSPADEGEEDPPDLPATYDAIFSERNDAVDVAMFLAQDRRRADRRVFGALLRELGDRAFRDILGAFFGEIKAGEVPRSRVAALLARLRAAERAASRKE